MDPTSERRTTAADEDERINRGIKTAEFFQLLQGALPLVLVSLTIAIGYAVIAATTEVDVVVWGIPLALGGFACSFLGYARRLREYATPDPPNTRGYRLLFLGWALTALAAVLPWYVAG